MDNKLIIGAIALAILLVSGYLISNSSAVVSAQGSSTIKAVPDKVSIYLNIEARNLTAQAAKAEHDKILDSLTISLLRAGLDKEDIKTISFNIYPEYSWDNGKQEQKGFMASHQLVIESKDFNLVPEIVDVAIDANALVSYINFELSDEKQSDYKAQALANASKDAKKKAEATASGLGKKLGKLVSVKNEEFNYLPYRYYDVATAEAGGVAPSMAVKDAASNLAPRDIEVQASVMVEYKISNF